MGLNKDQLLFDPTEDTAVDSVGAYVRSSDGTLITHSSYAGSVEALDVSIAGSSGTIDTDPGPIQFVLDGSPVTVLEDTVTPANNRPLPVKLTGITGDINITAGDLNVQLTHTGATPDSTQIGDGTETVNITPNNDMQVVDICNTAIAVKNVSVTATIGQLDATPLANRKYVQIQNIANMPMAFGPTGVTFGTGLLIPARSSWDGKIGAAVALYGIRNTGKTGNIRFLEAS
ncbi:MAG: hypothetical protein DRN81_02345 [Thermoproteota archaeon]|nr:MAG: hypothetical protein DRN81_02345 [Candidatus Korarchaeota archaeon]